MKISNILDNIDSGRMVLPEFQRGYVWNREQVRSLFESLFRRHPVGGLLVWVTESKTAAHRGGEQLPAGAVNLLLDGHSADDDALRGGPWQAADILRWEFPNLLQPHVPPRGRSLRVLPAYKDARRPIMDRRHRASCKKGVDGLGEFIDGLGLPHAKLTNVLQPTESPPRNPRR